MFWKLHKYLKIKQHSPKQPKDQRKIKKKIKKNTLRQTKMEAQHTKTYERQQRSPKS